jgi:MFS family permease
LRYIKSLFTRSYEGNIPKFFVYRALYDFLLLMPIWVIFLQDKHGLSLTEVTIIDFAFWMSIVLTEVPTGAVADTLGRKLSQFIGLALSAASILLFALAPTYPLLLVGNSLWAIAITFVSGADMAFFYDTLRELGREDEYPKLRGQLSAVALTSMGVSSALGGLVAEYDILLPFIISAGIMVVASLLVLSLKEPPREPDEETGEALSYLGTLQTALRAIRQHSGLRYALLYSSILPLMGMAIRIIFIQPYAVAIGMPLAGLGFLVFGLRGVQVVGAANAGRVEKRLGEWNLVRLAPVVTFIGLLAIGLFDSMLGIVIFGLTGFITAVSGPLLERIILRQSPGSVRATILSVESLIARLLIAVLEPGIGLIADSYSLTTAFKVMAIGHIVVLVLVVLLWGRVWDSSQAALPQVQINFTPVGGRPKRSGSRNRPRSRRSANR